MTLSGLEDLFVESFEIMNGISLRVMGLLRLSIPVIVCVYQGISPLNLKCHIYTCRVVCSITFFSPFNVCRACS